MTQQLNVGIYVRKMKMYVHRKLCKCKKREKNCTGVFIIALFLIANKRWFKKLWTYIRISNKKEQTADTFNDRMALKGIIWNGEKYLKCLHTV